MTVSSSSENEEEVERREPARRKQREKRRNRWERRATISVGSSSEEDWDEERRAPRRRLGDSETEVERDSPSKSGMVALVAEKRSQAVKSLKSWGMKFSGEDNEDPQEFLEQLQDCREGATL